MSGNVPTTGLVRARYCDSTVRGRDASAHSLNVTREEHDANHAEFDRWLTEVKRQAAEEAYEKGRLDERHDCTRYAEYQQGLITNEQLQRGLRSRNPYKKAQE